MDSLTTPPGKEDLLEIEGTVEHIVYQNENNGYTVCELEASDGDYVTLVGTLPFLSEGESIRALGRWSLHANFGRQFKVETYEKQLPANESSMLKYLASGAIKGVGPKLAQRIIDRFGTDSFEVIEHHPEWLADVEGITSRRAKKISERFKETFGIRSVMMFCREFFGPATAVKVYKAWGGGAIDIIKANPYALCETIQGIGFETADRIAASLGTDPASPDRLKAGILWFLGYQAGQNGHTFVPTDKLIAASVQFLGATEEAMQSALNSMISGGKVTAVRYSGREVIYRSELFEAERYTAAKLEQLHKLAERISLKDADRFIQQLEDELGITYALLQRTAILDALNSGVMVLTGGPGTGLPSDGVKHRAGRPHRPCRQADVRGHLPRGQNHSSPLGNGLSGRGRAQVPPRRKRYARGGRDHHRRGFDGGYPADGVASQGH